MSPESAFPPKRSALEVVSGGQDLTTVEGRQELKKQEGATQLASRIEFINNINKDLATMTTGKNVVEKIQKGELSEKERAELVERYKHLEQSAKEAAFMLEQLKK